ncbi:MAG: hypothetical protein GX754_02455, partial [Clostridiaceae bacterium]|nr:hypothetical protein [Clostridiaceae bacterium]
MKDSIKQFKPDFDEASRRWEAYYQGEIIDRPVVLASTPKRDYSGTKPNGISYFDKVFSDMEAIIDKALLIAESTFYGGESMPQLFLSFGPDEIAAYCGGELVFSEDSPNTNWSKPFVEDWESALPLRIRDDNALWCRLLKFHRKAAEKLQGRLLLTVIDLHTNMDLLSAVRGPENLCLDLYDQPEMIDKAMESARALFPKIWNSIREAGKMDEYGYVSTFFSKHGAATLQCDFSCMISPEMFKRWVLPALEEEAGYVNHALYHWDGPGALKHADALIASKGLHTLSFVPGAGNGASIDYLDLFKKVQKGGKGVMVWGTSEQIKIM